MSRFNGWKPSCSSYDRSHSLPEIDDYDDNDLYDHDDAATECSASIATVSDLDNLEAKALRRKLASSSYRIGRSHVSDLRREIKEIVSEVEERDATTTERANVVESKSYNSSTRSKAGVSSTERRDGHDEDDNNYDDPVNHFVHYVHQKLGELHVPQEIQNLMEDFKSFLPAKCF
jgi:hypothetical protein